MDQPELGMAKIEEVSNPPLANPNDPQPAEYVTDRLLGLAAAKARQSTKSNGTDPLLKKILMNPPRSCLLALSYATGPPDGETRCQGPSKRESG